MVNAKILSLICAILLLLPAFVLANEQGEGKLQLTDPVQIGSTQLQPGNYKVEWNGSGPTLNVKFIQKDKTVATASGKLIDPKKPASYAAVVLKPTGNGKAKTIAEIDFAHRTQALQIEPMMLSSSSPARRR